MLLLIDLKLNGAVRHQLSYVALEVGAIWKSKMAAILKFCLQTVT